MAREQSPQPIRGSQARQRPGAWQWLHGLVFSFGFAFIGVWTMLRHQRNAQIHLAIASLVVVSGLVLQVGITEWIALVLSITLVLSLEAFNTAIEAVVDLASPQYHLLAKQAKDVAASAVLIGAIGAAIVGLIIFVPKLWELL